MTRMLDRLVTRRFLFKTTGAAGVVAATVSSMAACGKKAQETKLAIVYTNDTHGHDVLDDESLGMAAAVQLRADYQAKGYEVLLLDAGDAVQGNNLVNRSKGDTAIDFMNTCAYDAMCLGNHEFDYGQDKVAEFVSQANFPLLCANITVDATGDTIVEPHTIFTLQSGAKVGVFGLTTPATYTTTNPLFMRGLTICEKDKLYECAQQQADTLRSQGCDLVVCLAHLGETDTLAPNRAMDVATYTKGIDLIIDGHDHEVENQTYTSFDGSDVLVVETGCYTHAIGVVTWENGTLQATLEEFGSYDGQDPEVAASIKQVADEIESELSDVIATSDFLLDGNRNPGVRTHETNLGDLITDGIMWEAQQMAEDTPDCVVINAGGIRDSLKSGDITLGDLLNVLPFTNYINTIEVTGAELLEALEASCAAAPDELGGFPQVNGIRFTVDTRVSYEAGPEYPGSTYKSPAKPGSRVAIHDVNGRGFDLEDTYIVASLDFVCAGGDTYYIFAQAATKTMKTIDYLESECVEFYLQEACGGKVPEQYADAAGQGRIEVVV